MSLFDSLREAEQIAPNTDATNQATLYDPAAIASEFSSYKSEPTLYPNATQYISPYAYDNWGGVTGILAAFDESARSPVTIIENKIDPNKIYTSELAALRSSAADQIRITKLFEKKLMEGLKDKDKFGLNENDIMAMQSLTAARSAVTAINKEMITIKKNISELRLKQEQARQAQQRTSEATGGVVPSTAGQTDDIGRSVLDKIFQLPGVEVDYNNAVYDQSQIMQDVDKAASIIDGMTEAGMIDSRTRYEHLNPTTYVQIGQSDDDVEFVTYSESGDIIEDYPNPITNIIEIDRENGRAKDNLHQEYPIRSKY